MDEGRRHAERGDEEKTQKSVWVLCVCVCVCVCVFVCVAAGGLWAKENRSGFHTLASSMRRTHQENTGGFHTLSSRVENPTHIKNDLKGYSAT